MIPQQPGMQQQPMGMQQQPQVDPQVMQITEVFSQSMNQGQQPQEIVMNLMAQDVDQNLIGQALMTMGYEQARAESMQEDAPAMDMNIDPINMAKSGIEIDPKNEGKFTAWAKSRGMTVKQAYNKVMSNTKAYPPSVVKMANFAKNAAGWKKEEGGEFEPHFMYKGDRKIRARDHEAHLRLKKAGYTHDAPKAQDGGEGIYDTPVSNRTPGSYIKEMNVGGYVPIGFNPDPQAQSKLEQKFANDPTVNQLSDFINIASKSNKNKVIQNKDNGYLAPNPMYLNPAAVGDQSININDIINTTASVASDFFGEDGAINAALLAASIIGNTDATIRKKLNALPINQK